MSSPSLSSIARGVPDADLLRHLARTNRRALEQFVHVAIDVLDAIDAPIEDLEPEHDYSGGEDDFDPARPALNSGGIDGAGCILSDDDIDVVYRPMGRTPAGRAERQYRRDVIDLKREHGVDDVDLVREAVRKLKRRSGTIAAH